jgi:hypothetical protein
MQRQCATRACANFYNSLHILHISNCFPFFVHTRLKLKSLLLASRIAKAIRISSTTTPTPLLQPTLTRPHLVLAGGISAERESLTGRRQLS